MKFEVAKQDLSLALDTVTSAMASGSDLSSHYVFRLPPGGDGSRMEVLTYNHGRLFSGCPFVAVVTGVADGVSSFTVDGKRLQMWLGAISDSALSFEFDPETKVVLATAPRGTQQFQSLDPINFPYWDAQLATAKQTCDLPADRFKSALDFARRFASEEDTKDPHLCVIEVRDSNLVSTDAKSASVLVSVTGLKDSALRVHVKDAAAVLDFLGKIKTANVKVLEHPRALILQREDGAILGETRFNVNFPAFHQPEVDDQFFWKLSIEDLKSGIQFLAAGAVEKDDRLTFTRPVADGPVLMTMTAVTGKPVTVEVGCSESGVSDKTKDIPVFKFVMSSVTLKKVLTLYSSEEYIRFGVNFLKKAGGFIRFLDAKFEDADGNNGDKYRLFVMWMK